MSMLRGKVDSGDGTQLVKFPQNFQDLVEAEEAEGVNC
jgi:hypothetical protein